MDEWKNYQRLVLSELKRHSETMEDIQSHILKMELELEKLKIKSGVWGLMGGLIPVIIAIAIELIVRK